MYGAKEFSIGAAPLTSDIDERASMFDGCSLTSGAIATACAAANRIRQSPAGREEKTYGKKSIDGETRGEWYLRQMLGSANISGNRLLHFMTGNLSFQIEHHLFPDLQSNRYQEIAPKIQELFERYGLTYVSGPMVKQVGSAWKKVFRLSLPNDVLRKATAAVKPASLTQLIFRPAAQVDATAA